MPTVLSRLLAVIFTVATFQLSCPAHASQTANLAWFANSESDIAGYRLYFGTTSGTYDQVRDVVTPYLAITGLTDGVVYYFAVTAYNLAGAESDFSNEVSMVASPACSSNRGRPRPWVSQ